MHARHEGKRRLSPSAATAFAAAAASAVAACLALLLQALMPDSTAALAALSLVLVPLLVGAAAWAAARRSMRAELAAASQAIARLAAQDFITPAPTGSADMNQLAAVIEHSRISLGERHKAAKVHAAVARLLGAAIGRLSEGDFTARIRVALPEPYRTFQNDFNTAMDSLETTFEGLGGTGKRLAGQATELGQASDLLARRAGKLAQRLEADLRVIDAGAARNPQDMLAIARNTMDGVVIATQRNIEAAAHFADLGSRLAQESERLGVFAGEEEPASPAASVSEPMTAAAFPTTLGATALKLHG